MKFITSDKVFSQLDRLAEWKRTGWTSPVTIEIHPSNKCNNACHYCSMWKVKDAKQMSKDELDKAIYFSKEVGAKGIIYSGGGEPLMNEHLIDSLEKTSMDQGIITNGVLLNQGNSVKILTNCKWVRVSLDAHTPELYKKIRGTNDFEKVVSNIKRLCVLKHKLKSNCTIGLQMVVDENNYNNLSDFVYWCYNTFPATMDYIQIRPIEIGLKDEPYSREQLSIIFKQINDDLIKLKRVVVSNKWDLFKGKREFGFSSCYAAPFIGVIDAYGDYYLCCHMVKQPEYKICNIKEAICNFIEEGTNSLEQYYKKFNDKLGFNPTKCPVGCRGSAINRRLEGLKHDSEHKNFL